jgi:hypothetical protein
MKRWEFLIQKEGDRAWLSLKEPTLELEEGKYRIVAHSNCANRDLEIRVTHQKGENSQSLRHSQKYYRQTNSEGLVMILPFTELKSGFWEFRCCGDLMSELLDEFWQESVQLKVVSKLRKSGWEAEFLPYPPTQSPSTPCPNPQAEHYLAQLEQLLRQEIEPMLRESDPCFQEIPTKLETDKFQSLSFAKIAAQKLKILLDRETFVRGKETAIAISGRIETLNPNPSENLELVILGKLLYEIRNPQTGDVCITLVQSLNETTLPYAFCHDLEIPREWEVPLLMGAVILETAAGLTVIRQPFIITADINQASEEVSEEVNRLTRCAIALPDFEDELSRTIDKLLAEEAKTPPLNLDLPDPSKMTKKLQHSQSVSEEILPPKLVSSVATQAIQLPHLPSLPKSQPSYSKEKIDNPLVESSKPDLEARKSIQETEELATASQQNSPVEDAFQALQLKERFLLRLNSLAEQKEKTRELVTGD